LPWLLNSAPLTGEPLSPVEQHALAEIQKTLALPAIPDNLLPRASALVPQLIALLRQTALPLPAIAERVAKDARLSAEVMRLASSSYYRSQGDVSNIQQAITLLGSGGLQTVIARVVLKPIFQGEMGLQIAGAVERLWEHSELLAQHAAALAEPAGQLPFDAYLTGLLHDTGWKIAFCALERAGITLDFPTSDNFASALSEQVHRLFGHATHGWAIAPGFTAFAHDARDKGLAASTHPMAGVLRTAQINCMNDLAA
jgi:HD-like signal output (HDOD) protein